MVSQLEQNIEAGSGFVKGRDFEIVHRILAPELVTLRADAAAGATSLLIKRLEDALSDGDALIVGKNMLVTLDGAAAAGVELLAVDAIPGRLFEGEILQKVRDLTGYTIEWELLAARGDATPLIATGSVTIQLLTQSGATIGQVRITGAAALTTALDPGRYFYALWRRNSGSRRPLAYGDIVLEEAGFL